MKTSELFKIYHCFTVEKENGFHYWYSKFSNLKKNALVETKESFIVYYTNMAALTLRRK